MFDKRCKDCFTKTYLRLFDKYNVEESYRKDFLVFLEQSLNNNMEVSSPEIQKGLNEKFCKIIGVQDPYAHEKKLSNEQALKLYKEWKPKILTSNNPFDMALRLTIAGNIMDYGANNFFDVHETIKKVMDSSFAIDDSAMLLQQINQAKRILYLGDNCGEIVFDKLLLEIIMHNNVVFATKESPILNDATLNDAKDIGMDMVADVISNGYNAPSTVLSKCSKEFLDVYKSADLIISKGQGNFEGLIHEKDDRIFFLLMTKCEVIAEKLGVPKDSFVVLNQGEKIWKK